MEKDLLFDDILKEKANNEKLVLPEKLNLKIKDTLDNLPERKKKSKFIKKLGIAAIIMIVCGIGVSVRFPALARNFPVISSVFQYLSEKNIIDKDYITYSSNLNMSKTCNGITVTINSIVYDDVNLSIGYTVESENEIKETPVIQWPNIKLNGKTVGVGGTVAGEFKDKKTYIGMCNINMSKDYLAKEAANNVAGGDVKIPEEFIMDFNIRELSKNVKGKWDFKFKVSSEKIKSNIKSIKPNVDWSSVGHGFKLNEIVITPINTALRIEELNRNPAICGGGGFIVFDDKKRPLEMRSESRSEAGDKSYTQIIFRNVYGDSKALTFIPYECTKDGEKELIKWMKELDNIHNRGFIFDFNEVPLNLNGTTILQEGKFGDYKVTKVEFLADKTLLYYECTNFLSMMSPYGISVIDGSGKKYYLNKNLVKEVDLVDHKYIAQLPVLNKEGKYKLIAKDCGKLYELREDAKVTVNIR